MKAKENIIPEFLSGGGQMGELIRSFDWSKNAIGSPDKWPQSLRIAVRIMLDSPFGMYIAWGKEYIQLYNNGYRPILGTTKHPQALGISTRQTFEEIWPTIGPMFEGVMQGTPVGFPDFVLQLNRNGFLEECVFDFSYSPIRLEDGEVGGVLVTVIETTERVKAAKALKESAQDLQFAIDATELGTWDLNPATNKFRGNRRLKEWFGLRPDEEIELPLAIAVIAEKDRDKVTAAIQTALQFSSGGHYDIIYTIIHPQTKNERIVRAKGQAFFNDEGIAYRVNGTLQDVTKEIAASKLLKESEQRLSNERMVLYNSFMNAPAGIAILKGDTHIYEFANAEYEKLVDRKITPGKTVQELFPEIEQQGLIDILNNVFSTGQPFIANEFPVELINERTGKEVLRYYNSVMQPMKDAKGNTERILAHAVEVTQQVEARKQIEASQQRFGAAVEAVQGILWTNNAKGEMEGEQKGWAALTGQSYEEYQGFGWATAVHPDDAQPTIDAWHEAVNESKTFVFEHRVKTRTDKWELFAIKAIPLLNKDGSIREWIGVHTNITEQREAEEKIKDSEAQFKMLSETIPHMVWTASADGKKNFFNQYFLQYTGLSFEELKGDGWQSTIFPDDLQKELQQWHHTIKTGEDFKIEKRVRHHTGTYRWHLSHGIAQKNAEGKIIGWIGTSTEIEEQKKFTEELETKVKERTEQLQLQNQTFELAESIAQFGSYRWHIATGGLEYSDNLFRLLDCEPGEFIPSFEKFLTFIHPDDLQQVIKNGEQTTQTGRLVETPYRIISKAGTTKHFRSSGKFSGDGVNRILIGTVQDISKDVQATENIKATNTILEATINELQNSNLQLDQKDEFISIASHEMRTPLTTAKGYLELLLLTLKTENVPTAVYAAKATDALRKLNDLILELLDASKIQNGQLNYNITTFDFNKMVDETIENMQLTTKNHSLQKVGGGERKITGDKDRLQQVLINFLTNAIKYSPGADKVLIKIEDQDNKIQVSVQDFGIGMAGRHLEKIFDRYYRVQEHSIHFQGLGIGLYISSNIIQRHNGKMWAESEPGKGSTFYFSLPL